MEKTTPKPNKFIFAQADNNGPFWAYYVCTAHFIAIIVNQSQKLLKARMFIIIQNIIFTDKFNGIYLSIVYLQV